MPERVAMGFSERRWEGKYLTPVWPGMKITAVIESDLPGGVHLGRIGSTIILRSEEIPEMANVVRFVVAVTIAARFGGVAAGDEAWDPTATHAVIAGVAKWPNQDLTPFSTRNRKDQELRDLLVKRGVPAKNVALLLDMNATRDKILAALRDAARAAKPGETLIVYYAGHGSKVDGDFCFANYDLNSERPKQTGLMLSDVGEVLASGFRGGRVLLMADCCHSGGLATVVRRLEKAKIPAASLTSADASNISTGNWTFTQTILDGLAGDPLSDTNGDGVVTLAELRAEVESAMKFLEGQRSGYANATIPSTLVLAKVPQNASRPKIDRFSFGSYVSAPDQNRKRPARVIGERNGEITVRFYDYADKHTANVPVAKLAKLEFKNYAQGESLHVLWEGKLWKASVLQKDGDFHLIHYEGYEAGWDEWVLANRIVPANEAPNCEVEWQKQWYAGRVMKSENGKWFVHYVGFDDSWDEWVGKDRIRFRK
jgi:hypothetical protein